MPVISSGFEIRVSDKNHLIRVELLGKVCSDVCLLDLFFFVLSEKDAHQLLGYLVGYPICLESRASWRIRLSRSDSDMELCRKISSASTQ